MRSRSWLVPLGWAVSLVLAAVVGVWATRASLPADRVASQSSESVLYRVTNGSVSRILSFTAEAKWQATPLARNGAQGIVTTRDVQDGDEVDVGTTLYTVDLRPVVAAVGAVPAFRDLEEGSVGRDVRQLQGFLSTVGHFAGRASGTFDAATQAAVRAWQRDLGEPVDGAVKRGDLLYFPRLPARVVLDEAFLPGAPVSGGEIAVEALPAGPTFSVTLAAEQADLVPLTASVVVHHDDGAWDGKIMSSKIADTGELVLSLGTADGTPLCAADCGSVPIATTSTYVVDIVAVPETAGPLVPAAALRTEPSGSVYLVGANGAHIAVKVRAAAEGRAIVSGVDEGQMIQLFAAAGINPTASPSG